MRLHKPVPPHHQPHLAHSFASSGARGAAAGAGYDDGGTVDPMAFLDWPKTIDKVGAGYAEGGTIDPSFDSGTSGQGSGSQYNHDPSQGEIFSADTPLMIGGVQGGMPFRYTGEGTMPGGGMQTGRRNRYADQLGFDAGGDVQQVDYPALAAHANEVYNAFHADMENRHNAAQQTNQMNQFNQPMAGQSNTAQTANQGYDQGGGVVGDGYRRGGKVKKKQWANQPDKEVWGNLKEPGEDGPPGLPETSPGSGDYVQDGGQSESSPGSGDYTQGFAQGGGVPMPPGPAGAGVKPHATTGNAGRPGYTAPDPIATSQEKNYTQNVTSRPATSPSKGTAFEQAGPDGGQRGQEFYGKGVSPYGPGRKKKKNG